MNTRIGLTACGFIALIAVAGCGSGGGGGLTGSTAGSWARSLGSGVTVTGPGGASTASGAPGAVMQSVVNDLQEKQYSKLCDLYQASVQAECSTAFSSESSSAIATDMPTTKSFAVGYTAIDGDEALVGTTGTFCAPNQTPGCYTNNDPAAILDSGKSFATLWSQTASSSNSGTYSLAPLVKVNGTWYVNSAGD
jgi:hypothetical protein